MDIIKEKMIQDLVIRGMSKRTQESYLGCKRLPVVLSKEEVAQLYKAVSYMEHKAMILTLYCRDDERRGKPGVCLRS